MKESDELGTKILDSHLLKILGLLTSKGTAILTGTKLIEITDKGVVIENSGKKQIIEADTILTAIPPKPNPDLLEDLKQKITVAYQISDSKEPRLIVDTVSDRVSIWHEI